MTRDSERRDILQQALKHAGLDALVCTLPSNVLLLSGYFPVVGTSMALFTSDGDLILLVPEDEASLTDPDSAEIVTFHPGSLDKATTASEAIRDPLSRVLREHGLERAAIGCESGACYQPSSYVSMHLYGGSCTDCFAQATLRPTGELLEQLRSTLTCIEIDRLRRACRIAGQAYLHGGGFVSAGMKECEVAAAFTSPLTVTGIGFEGVTRVGGEVYCMSGPNSAQAHAAYARTRARQIEVADFVMLHCNSHADGYWTDITRTFTTAPVEERHRKMYQAVWEARQAALAAIRPGVTGAAVDRAARDVIAGHGWGDAFKHGTGHGVGFPAISHDARPRIHPRSDDRLEAGMVFNVEPALYFEGFGGLRHCDMVLVTHTGAEVLTPFQSQIEDLLV
jgi:Xaa-Pro dipeptidase